jgi:hypothetical protein
VGIALALGAYIRASMEPSGFIELIVAIDKKPVSGTLPLNY